MRLLKRSTADDFKLITFPDDDTPPYAILSHTWSKSQEVTYDELVASTGKDKAGYAKIRFCAGRAAADGLEYFWVDTCCIDKSTSDELSTAINSMFRWYQRASKCYVYLSDISVPDEVANASAFRITWAEAFRRSRWFTRGWTLQELLAPASVEFFSKEGELLGSRISLEQEIHETTKIPIRVLRGQRLAEFSVEERMSWAAKRTTTLKEDKVYCLLGIFEVFLSLIYGEGEAYATLRLREEIQKREEGRKTESLHDSSVSSSFSFPRNELIISQQNQTPESYRKRKRQDLIIQQCKRCCQLLQQNIPPQVLLEAPIILFDGFDKCFAFSLNWISSLNFFREVMAAKAKEELEDRFKEKGYAKIWEGDFLLQDQCGRNLELRRPWKFIMKPGEQRYMSIKFRENVDMQTKCPHCGAENKAAEGKATIWRVLQDQCRFSELMTSSQSCQVTYERIIGDNDDNMENSTPKICCLEELPKDIPPQEITEEELKYCFRRLTLTAPAPPISGFDSNMQDLGLQAKSTRKYLALDSEDVAAAANLATSYIEAPSERRRLHRQFGAIGSDNDVRRATNRELQLLEVLRTTRQRDRRRGQEAPSRSINHNTLRASTPSFIPSRPSLERFPLRNTHSSDTWRGRHNNSWLFNSFSIRETAKSFVYKGHKS